jgi:hypothetical protein
MSAEPGPIGPARDWLDLFLRPGQDAALCAALGLQSAEGGDQAVLAVANDLGLLFAHIDAVQPAAPRKPKPGEDEAKPDLARQWQFADPDTGVPAIIVPVASDPGRPAYDPGEVTLSLERLGDEMFQDSIADLVALPLGGQPPLSLTGLSFAVGRFAVRERGEVEIYGGGLSWLTAHLQRARDMETELPAHLVAAQLGQPEHFNTLLIEPKAIEWRPSFAWCPLPRETKSVVVRDSLGLASFIGEAMRRKLKVPALPKVFGPKAGAA